MFNLKKLFGFEPMEEDMPMRIEPQLPKKDVDKGDVYYHSPLHGAQARFFTAPFLL